jgi:transcriptional regulator with XRE-family HTH domain
MTYTACNTTASANLHPVAFGVPLHCGIPYAMGKHRSFIKNWRLFRGMKQREVIERLTVIRESQGLREKFPTTEASLSRVEAGDQNFNMALLSALAEVFEVESPGDLLTVNPFAGTLSVIRALEQLSPVQQEAALRVIEAMRTPLPESEE